MKLPWYVALDRWVRRNETTVDTVCVLGALWVAVMVALHSTTSGVMGVVFVALGGYAFLILFSIGLMVLERYADEWRETHYD